MSKYAKTTTVSVAKSRADIEKLLIRYGIEEFGFGTSPRGSGIQFTHKGKTYRISVMNVDRKDMTEKQYEQAMRQRWRVLKLNLHGKLEYILDGASFEDEFLAYTALPDGSTVGDFMRLPENVKRISEAKMPTLLICGVSTK